MSSNPFMDYQETFVKMWKDNMDKMMDGKVPGVEQYWKTMTSFMPGAKKEEAKKDEPLNPVMEYWKKMTESMQQMTDYWKPFLNAVPNVQDYFKAWTDMIPGMSTYWDSFAKMMPDPSKFASLAPFKVPGLEGFTKVFDLWKSFGDPTRFMDTFQEKYMDVIGDVIKGLFPENMQAFVMKPMDFMNMMVEYYKQYVAPWMEIDPDIMKRLAEGDVTAYTDFFRDYQAKYEESIEKYFNIMGMGLNREANEDYMKAMNTWNKAMISMGELMAVITETSVDSGKQIMEKLQEDLKEGKSLTTFKDFYDVWYSVTEAAFEKLLATDEFAKVFDDFSDRYAQYMIAQNKVYERMLAFLPIPTNKDMKSLYKTVYDLRKEVRDLKKALASKEDKKGE